MDRYVFIHFPDAPCSLSAESINVPEPYAAQLSPTVAKTLSPRKATRLTAVYRGPAGPRSATVVLFEPFTVGNLAKALRDLAQHLEDAES